MERRNQLLLLILAGLILLGIGIWYLLAPIIRPEGPVQQVETGTGTPTTKTPTTPTQNTPTPTANPPQPVSASISALADFAGIVVARVGSGSNGDGFRGYEDALINVTPGYQAALKAEQAAMQKLHPAAGSAYGIVTRVVAADTRSVVEDSATAEIIIQVQQAEDTGNPAAPSSVKYKEVTVQLQKQANGKYLVSNMVWKDLSL